jgi:hypothetical protein
MRITRDRNELSSMSRLVMDEEEDEEEEEEELPPPPAPAAARLGWREARPYSDARLSL